MGIGWVLLLFAAIAIELHSAGVSMGYMLLCILSACYFVALVASKYERQVSKISLLKSLQLVKDFCVHLSNDSINT